MHYLTCILNQFDIQHLCAVLAILALCYMAYLHMKHKEAKLRRETNNRYSRLNHPDIQNDIYEHLDAD